MQVAATADVFPETEPRCLYFKGARSSIHKGGPSQAPRRDCRWFREEGACWWHVTDEGDRLQSREQAWGRETL